MSALSEPDCRFHSSFLVLLDEWGSGHIDGAGLETIDDRSTLRDPAEFGALVDRLRADSLEDSPRPDGYVPCTFRWITDGDEMLGFLAIRHRFTPFLLDVAGHIGYAVRPSFRRRGVASRALADALPIAAGLGIDRMLLTCDDDNIGSARTIESNGGELEDIRNGKRRYWIDVVDSPSPSSAPEPEPAGPTI